MVQPGQNGNLPLAENIYDSKDLMIRKRYTAITEQKIYAETSSKDKCLTENICHVFNQFCCILYFSMTISLHCLLFTSTGRCC